MDDHHDELGCRKHSLIIPPFPFRTYAAAGLSVFAILTALGTYERTGLIAIGIAIQQYVERYEKAQRVPVRSLTFQEERGPVRPVHT